jgi:hypothetical protein
MVADELDYVAYREKVAPLLGGHDSIDLPRGKRIPKALLSKTETGKV